jgi:hypothetical protein
MNWELIVAYTVLPFAVGSMVYAGYLYWKLHKTWKK